ncbi:DUF2786 domain-containing protein [Dickeya ananatis]|uniref:DUF2786 domain-containing protein n=1 Tax=Dickeya ananatis TaxID=3061286 RepID=UPI001CE68C09|nr:DUF2786 domain-containing protein [Dickeya zeae]
MSDSNKEKYLEKIKKLLNLARRSTNENEAANAISQAQNLMRAHGLNESDIDLMDIKESGSKDSPSHAEKLPQYVVYLSNLLCHAFGVHCYYTQSFLGRSVVFYGPNERPQIAAYGFDVLTRQLRGARTDYIASLRKSIKRSTKINRADQFCEGWISGAWKAISAFSVNEREKTLMESYRKIKLEGDGFSTLKSREAKKCRGDEDARWAGYQAGKEAKLHHAVNGAGQDAVAKIERK